MTKIELVNEQEIREFKDFCEFKQAILAESAQWKRFKTHCKELGFGNFICIVENGVPIRAVEVKESVSFLIHNARLGP
jgi:hypothetical protein